MTSGRLPLYLIVLVTALAQARAAPLDGDTCARLKSEQTQLELAGIEQDMAKGPAWAKANLVPEKLAQVRRFIELEEQLLFRCRGKSLVTLPAEPELAATGGQADQDKETAAPKALNPAPGATHPEGQAAGPKQKAKAPKKAAVQPPDKPASQPKKPQSGAAKKPPAKAAARPSADGKAPPPAPVTTIVKSPPKAKVDDAYRVPPPDPAVNPFAGQLNLPAKD